MTAERWEKYFYSDWMGDRGLRLCSLAARGLWHEMNAVMYGSPVRGYLLCQDSAAMTATELAKVVSAKPGEVRKLLAELERHRVFSIEPQTGAIFCRRIIRSDRRAEASRENGRLGGRPKDEPKTEPRNNLTETKPVKVSRARDRDQKPESRSTPDSQKQNPVAPADAAPSVAPVAQHQPKEPKDPTAAAWIRDVFVPLYAKYRNGAAYFVAWEKHAPMVARLLKAHDPERLRKLAVVMLRTDDEWISGTDRGIEILATKVNWLEDRLREWEAKQARPA